MMVEVEKNIPIPRRVGNNKKYPLAEMEIGDSIVVPRNSVSTVAYARNTTGHQFTVRRIGKASYRANYRVWRTA